MRSGENPSGFWVPGSNNIGSESPGRSLPTPIPIIRIKKKPRNSRLRKRHDDRTLESLDRQYIYIMYETYISPLYFYSHNNIHDGRFENIAFRYRLPTILAYPVDIFETVGGCFCKEYYWEMLSWRLLSGRIFSIPRCSRTEDEFSVLTG